MADTEPRTDFIREAVREDLESGRFAPPIVTRFPPEPNGFLHIGHVKALAIDYGIAREFGGRFHLRWDDTNPETEKQEYVDAIREDMHWLGFDWGEHEYYASDYFEQLYQWACDLIRAGKAYVDDQSAEEIRLNRGTLTEPGTPSPYRDRAPRENLDLFERMRRGEYPNGARVLRAKIDMASPNMNLRDPVMYRILHAHHHRTGDAWPIYPMYDWAHGQSDSIERITHSLCSIEFKPHRPLYEWFIEQLGIFPSRQIEFARGNITHMVTAKRKMLRLVNEGYVSGWDDPRMSTVAGMRRRGYPAAAIREFWEGAGVARRDNNIELARLEFHVRQHLNHVAQRRMVVLDPLRVIITNYPEGRTEHMEAVNNPENDADGTRAVPFARELFIERDDFMEDPPKNFFRLGPGREVRLRYAYWITCREIVRNDAGEVIELRCTYDPETRGGHAPADGRKVRGTLHWVAAEHAVDVEVRLYDTLFSAEDPGAVPADGPEFISLLNPDSLRVTTGRAEPSVRDARPGDLYQFERHAYFAADRDGTPERPVFNRTVTLKESWKGG